jgi:hypothetical protein
MTLAARRFARLLPSGSPESSALSANPSQDSRPSQDSNPNRDPSSNRGPSPNRGQPHQPAATGHPQPQPQPGPPAAAPEPKAAAPKPKAATEATMEAAAMKASATAMKASAAAALGVAEIGRNGKHRQNNGQDDRQFRATASPFPPRACAILSACSLPI